jgi:Ohr subfamily peroxiredoxin
METIYTAIAHATGGGRDGHVRSDNDRLDLDTRIPTEMGGSGEGTNPEELFAAGYAACFLSAVHAVGRGLTVDTKDASVSASIAIGKIEGGMGLSAELDVYLPGIEAGRRQEVADAAHQLCPYSNATRGNMDVVITIVD